jgi:hypothetical protein
MNANTPFLGRCFAIPERHGPISLGVRWNRKFPTANRYAGSVAFERGLVVAYQADGWTNDMPWLENIVSER